MKRKQYCKCGDSLDHQGVDRRGFKDKTLCWICDMEENPEAYKSLGGGKSLRRSWSAESIEKALEEVEKVDKKKTRKLVVENE